jgi:type IX secretion system PorP/SprF family membrane protein
VQCQENQLTQYFASASYKNPACAGDTRHLQIGLANRIQPLTGASPVYNTLFTFDQKLRNYRSGLGLTINQKTAGFRETQYKINYSHTWRMSLKYWLKGGLGLSWNFINSNATNYHYPDQYDSFGITGEPTGELNLNERANFPAFAAGVLAYDEFGWISVSVDYLNRPKQDFAGVETRIPVSIAFHGGYLFQIDKYQRPRRIINRKGGLEPYSSIGPVAGFYKQGPFYSYNLGINTFLQPVFAGLVYHQNRYIKDGIRNGVSSLNLLLGFRNEKISLSYSYDFMISRTVTNYRGAHEVSVIFYIYTIKEDYSKNKLISFPNQLMY